MKCGSSFTRRQFIATAAAATAATALPTGDFALAQAATAVTTHAPALDPDWSNAGIVATRHSPYAKLRPVPVHAVTIAPGFWSKRRQTNVDSSIPSMRVELIEHGRMDNFLRLEGKSAAPQIGPVYSDSDIYKWMEAVGFALQSGSMPELRATTDEMIRQVVAAQEPGGYLNTYFVESKRGDRMLPKTQTGGHELYCIGHLLQGGIAYYRATGDPALLNAGMRFLDDFLLPGYGPGPNQGPIVAGHPEIEMALIELYRTTGNRRYLELAGYILRAMRGFHYKSGRLCICSAGSVYFANQAGRARGARHVCLLRGNGLLPGNRGSGLLEDAEPAVGRSGGTSALRNRRGGGHEAMERPSAMPMSCLTKLPMARAARLSAT